MLKISLTETFDFCLNYDPRLLTRYSYDTYVPYGDELFTENAIEVGTGLLLGDAPALEDKVLDAYEVAVQPARGDVFRIEARADEQYFVAVAVTWSFNPQDVVLS